MKMAICAAVFFFSLQAMSLSAIPPDEAKARTPTPDQIRAGVKQLTDLAFALYPVPYRFCSMSEWQARIKRINEKADRMSDAELFVETQSLVGALRDVHSWAWIDDDSGILSKGMPVRFWRFDDGLYVRASAPNLSRLVGARVLAVDGIPIEDVWKRLIEVQPGPNDSMAFKSAQVFLQIPGYLQALGVGQSEDTAVLRLQFPDNRIEDVNVAAVKYSNLSEIWLSSLGFATPAGWTEPGGAAKARWLARRGEAFWFEYIKDTRTIFMQINQAVIDPENPWNPKHDHYREFLEQVFAFIQTNPVDRLVIDLRHNGGGDESMWQQLAHRIIRADKINQPGRVFVLIGRLTESAAVAWAARLESETMALFAGEPSASPPNYYNDPAGFARQTFHIPGSPINFRFARQLDVWSNNDDQRNAIYPDFKVGMTYREFAQGDDPVLNEVVKVDPAKSKGYFLTVDGEDVTNDEQSHYSRKSQLPALLPRILGNHSEF